MPIAPIPVELQSKLRGYHAVKDGIGQSGDCIFRLEAPSRPTLILKVFATEHASCLQRETARINWLRSVGIRAPRILDAQEAEASHWFYNGMHSW